MKAICIFRNGGTEVMEWSDVELPPPSAGRVRVRHTAIGVNFSDINVRNGGFYLGDKTPAREQWLEVDQWYCLEVMGFGDDLGDGNTQGDGEEVRVWLDEMEIEGLHADDAYWQGYGSKERWSPKYDGSLWSFGIGGQAPQNGQKIDIWYDALAFSSERIGCAK